MDYNEAMIAAVHLFNSAGPTFRAEFSIVTANIAWTYLLRSWSKKESFEYWQPLDRTWSRRVCRKTEQLSLMMISSRVVKAAWLDTSNRHLDPSVLSLQLRRATDELALWEWRPAFMSREKQKASSGSIASTHPYTVLARPSNALYEEVVKIL
ncbi:hypothetical protein J7394_03035 [Ruegeria sp. R13_0]|uniref:DUF3644 domain-containing protein n=1 Tax=Ruegeria sp. R13_0 TaxID=2821099 RepID=UPI001ADBC9C6|nr:DUF3644 domain-containing protein [Ruegeria sp. R13_0]MBO9433163.1 hypothetical protein [Ruegeria sp. R13_0]